METSLSYRGYSLPKSALSEGELKALRDELTVKPFVPKDYEIPGQDTSFKVYQESASRIYIPKMFGLKRYGIPSINKLHEGQDIDVPFAGSLRKEQEAPTKAFLAAAYDPARMGGVLNMACAAGKTVMALYLISTLAKKTLVIVHKDFLLQQWRERIEQFLPTARLGVIKAKKVDFQDADIVLASLQSLSMKEYDDDVFKDFGTVVVDECHHTSAEVFSRALRKVNFKYSLGLSATIQRKDGLTKVFLWYLGDVVYSAAKRKGDTVSVKAIEYYEPHPGYSQECIMGRDKLNISRMLNNICAFPPRTKRMLDEWKRIFDEEPQRRTLVLSDRRTHLQAMAKILKDEWGIDSGMYVGGVSQEELKRSETAPVILGTYQFCSEGFDVQGLDTLILASPKSDVIQSVGRILRQKPEDRKHIPLIIDIMDMFSIFERQSKKRLAYYKKCGYDIQRDALYSDGNDDTGDNNNGDGDGDCADDSTVNDKNNTKKTKSAVIPSGTCLL